MKILDIVYVSCMELIFGCNVCLFGCK